MKQAIYRFRNNLRLKDNPSLHRALSENDEILPVYVLHDRLFGKHELGFGRCGAYRWKFLVETLHELKENLRGIGGDLLILKGDPVTELTKLASKHNITDIYGTREMDYDELQEESQLSKQFNPHLEHDQLLVDPQQLPYAIDEVPTVFTNFRKSVEKNMMVRAELPSPEKINAVDVADMNEFDLDDPELAIHTNSAFPYEGGESVAWDRLNEYFWEKDQLKNYKFTRNGLIGKDYSSKFSPFLALGSISPVSIFHEVKKYEEERKKNVSTYWLVFELLWREFFKLQSAKHGADIFKKGGILNKQINYANDMANFTKWIESQTGDDFVDANMRELKQTGFMSNRGRQNVASYLAHDLEVDWRWGAAYFESQLVDYDCASNWCNWMYVAGVGNDPRQRKFDTRWQADKYDGKGAYRKLWLESREEKETSRTFN